MGRIPAERRSPLPTNSKADSPGARLAQEWWLDTAILPIDEALHSLGVRVDTLLAGAVEALQAVTDADAVEEYHTPVCRDPVLADPGNCVACIVRSALTTLRGPG